MKPHTLTYKFRPGQKVWCMLDNKPYETPFFSVEITIESGKITILYHFDGPDQTRPESQVFATKPELLASL